MALYIPPEILAEIFMDAVDTNGITDRNPTVAMSLSAVCSTWRSVALSASAIWARISARINLLGPDYVDYPAGLLPRLELHLARSRSELLDLTLQIDNWVPEDEQRVIDHLSANVIDAREPLLLLKAILSESHRTKRISLLTDETFSLHYLQALSILRLFPWGNMQSVELKLPFGVNSRDETIELIEVFGISNPNLCHLWFSDTPGSFPNRLSDAFPSSQITHLRVGHTFNRRSILCLSHFTGLISARFGVSRDEDDEGSENEEQTHLVLPHLRSLTLDIREGYSRPEADLTTTSIIHDALTLPSLEHLAYTCAAAKIVSNYDPESGSSIFVNSLLHMLARSSSSISSFHLEGIPIKDAEILPLLKQMPLLEELELREASRSTQQQSPHGDFGRDVMATSQLLEALTLTSNKDQLLPRLRRIILWTYTHWKNGPTLEAFLESRIGGQSGSKNRPLESAYLHLVDEHQDAKWTFDQRRLKAVQEGGIAVKLVQHFDQDNLDSDTRKILFGYE
ncbi:hypothetical protein VNI00_017534 [Paramarasmius palmivorus]|uniref:F-box domain-containing protein n=1 Tax=Paramarasmius palmivorus TaxID=297713 RepID=A0AAW0B4U6_9AGAR